MFKVLLPLAVFFTALLGWLYPVSLPLLMLLSLGWTGYIVWTKKQKGFRPQSDTYKELEKIKKKRYKTETKKHQHINDQIAYIDEVWGYTQEQKKIIQKFIDERAYSQIYNKLTASLLPQMITLIDNCNNRAQKGCKREVAKRLRELSQLMKKELHKKRSQNIESFETTLEVYDQLLSAQK